MSDDRAGQVPVEQQIANLVWELRNGYRMTLEHKDQMAHVMVGTDLEAVIADRLEQSIGIRRIDNDDGSTSIKPLSEVG